MVAVRVPDGGDGSGLSVDAGTTDFYAEFWRKLERRLDVQHRQRLEVTRARRERLGELLPKPSRFWTRTCLGPNCHNVFKTSSPYHRLCENCVKTVRDAPFAEYW